MPLPPGVTLQAIDGGPTYYASNGFTAATNTSFNGTSWDDPSFFPISQDDIIFKGGATPATFRALGLNVCVRFQDASGAPDARAAGIWAIPSADNIDYGGYGAETAGWHIEEPQVWDISLDGGTWDVVQRVQGLGSLLAGRVLQLTTGVSTVLYGLAGAPGDEHETSFMPALIGTSGRHLDINSADAYWFAGSPISAVQAFCGTDYGLPGDATANQVARGSNYGDQIDQMRSQMPIPAPIGAYIETSDGLEGTGSRQILPQEWNWAVWSTLVHGARIILNFSQYNNFNTSSTFGFDQAVLSGATVSMYDQAVSTHTLIRNVAPVLNSPFALNYATVTPAGYTFPVPHLVLDNGIDVMTKYFTGASYSNSSGNFTHGFYVFAVPRGSGSQTNISATFTIAGSYSGPVHVIGENRTVTAAGGQFTDTFAHASTVHIYQIELNMTYESTVLADSPSFLWLLNENSGSTAADATGNGNTGTYSGGSSPTTLHVPPFQSTATDFTVSGAVSADGTLTAVQTVSAEGWFNTTSALGGAIFQYGSTNFVVYMHNDGTLTFGVWTGSQVVTAGPTATAFNDGAWHHVVATFSSAHMYLYVDAAQVATATASAYAAGNSTWFVEFSSNVSSAWPGTQTNSGLLAYYAAAAVYPVVLTPTQVTAHYNAGIAAGGGTKYLTGSATAAIATTIM